MKLYGEYTQGKTNLKKGHISYLVRKRAEPWMILLPGSWCDTEQWNEVIDHLEQDLSLLLVNLRGHGSSWPPSPDGSMEQLAGDVISVVETLSLNRFFVGGHSIGGMTALEIGRILGKNHVQGIISVEGWTRHTVLEDAFDGLKNNTLSASQEETISAVKRRVTDGWSEKERENFASIWQKWDGYDFLCSTDMPILEIWGDRGLGKRPDLKSMAIPERENIQLTWVSNASHYLPLEKPYDIAQAITGFIRKNKGWSDNTIR